MTMRRVKIERHGTHGLYRSKGQWHIAGYLYDGMYMPMGGPNDGYKAKADALAHIRHLCNAERAAIRELSV